MPTNKISKRTDDLLLASGSGKNWSSIGVDATEKRLKYNCDGTIRRVKNMTELTEVVTTTNVITASESGSVFFLSATTGFVSTLPAVAAGLRFTFIISTGPTSGSHTVVGASGTPIKGHVLTNDVNSATDSDFGTTGELTLTFVQSKAVAGDKADFYCDGTNWFVSAACSVFDAITIS